MKYDIIIIGMGPSSIFCAYELLRLNSNKKILLIEKGKKVEERICPISKTGKCLKCKPICSIIGGFSGAGAFSDGKLLSYHLSSYNELENDLYIGGKDNSYIKEYYTKDEIKRLIEYTDNLYLELGATNIIEGMNYKEKIKEMQDKASKNSLKLVDVPIRHLGTEKSRSLYKKLQDILSDNIDMMFNTEVMDLLIDNNKVKGVVLKDKNIYSNKVIMAVGIDGSEWLEGLSNKYNIKRRNGYMDIGIRYELKDEIMADVNKYLYEGKFIGNLEPYKDRVRTYCQNPSGFVTPETYDNGYTLVNGHAYKDIKSNNTNLAILVSYKFDEPFNSPIKYGFNIAEKANLLTGGTVIVQRYEDFKKCNSTSKEVLENNAVIPTMKSACPGDLSYVLDYRTYVNIKNFIEKVDKVIPGFKCDDNLLYGPEIKFYGNELVLNKNLETSIEGLYSIGTGGGLTIGLMMASVSGVLMAKILEGSEI